MDSDVDRIDCSLLNQTTLTSPSQGFPQKNSQGICLFLPSNRSRLEHQFLGMQACAMNVQ
ncbi:unnamed protein product [Sphenostylis stenocarpa]|uniref:Uncharacterized protein n=1 Tax=Sphenostylis stenocarpa TaxID=92480 RepID=A0AA86SMI2_9FABA|nr:unnamed protein product [Sphenostylis stenocarpa]